MFQQDDIRQQRHRQPAPQPGVETPGGVLKEALDWHAQGYAVVPCWGKQPQIPGWNQRVLGAEEIEAALRNGATGFGFACGLGTVPVVAVDLDWPEARRIASRVLPRTGLIDGRPSTGPGHYFYRAEAGTLRLTAPGGGRIVEILGRGAFVVVPPSPHPSREARIWLERGEPAPVDPDELARRVMTLAAALLARHWREGLRQDATLALAGVFRWGGRSLEEALEFIGLVCEAAQDEEWDEKRRRAVRDTFADAKTKIMGRPTLERLLGAEVVARALKWLGLDRRRDHLPTTEAGLAEVLAELVCLEACWVRRWECWLIYDGKRWAEDADGLEFRRLAREKLIGYLSDLLKRNPNNPDITNLIRLVQSKGFLERVVDLARDYLWAEPEEFDRDPWLLNCENGTVDLRTGELRPHNPGDKITKLCPTRYIPGLGIEGGRFDEFLRDVFRNDAGLIDWVQVALGYSITGGVWEQKLFLCIGPGANGKSTLLNLVREVLGPEYSGGAPADLFVMDRADTHPTVLADLCGKRFVTSAEIGDGRRLHEERLKALTGGEAVKARRMRQDYWEFKPTFKLWAMANQYPVVRDFSYGFWRRIIVIPFDATIPEEKRIRGYHKVLAAEEGELVLAWLVEGAVRYCRETLPPLPERIKRATAEFRAEQDPIHDWVEERCVWEQDVFTSSKDLYADYQQWCEANGLSPIPADAFGRRLKDHGFKPHRTGTRGRGWIGVRLRREGELVRPDGGISRGSVASDASCILAPQIPSKPPEILEKASLAPQNGPAALPRATTAQPGPVKPEPGPEEPAHPRRPDRVVYCRGCRRPRVAIRTAQGWELECGHDLAEAAVLYHQPPGPCYSCGGFTGAIVDTRKSPLCPECGTEYAVTQEAVEEVRGALRPRNWPEAYVAFCWDCYYETRRGRVAVEWDPELGLYLCPRAHDPASLYRLNPGVQNCPRCGAKVDLSGQACCPTCGARFIRDHEEDEGLLEALRGGGRLPGVPS